MTGQILRSRGGIWAIFSVAIAVRVFVAWTSQSWIISSEGEYWNFGYEMGRIAGSLASGRGFTYPTHPPQPTAWMAPIYPYFLSIIFRIFGAYSIFSAILIYVLQIAASVLSCFIVYKISDKIFGRLTAFFSGILLAFYPASVHYSVQKMWSTTFFSTALLVALLLLVDQAERPTRHGMVLVGLVFGLGALLNPLLLGVLLPAVAWLDWRWRRDGTARPLYVAAAVVTSIVVISPWLLRNQLLFDRLVLIKSNFGHELLVGNHPYSTGSLPHEMSGIERQVRGLRQPVPGVDFNEQELAMLSSFNEVEKNRFYLREALDYIIEEPDRFCRLSWFRFLRYWTNIRSLDSLQARFSRAAYAVVLILAIVGIVSAIRARMTVGPLLITLIFFPIPYYVTVIGLYRYRFPLEPVLIMFAALTVATIFLRVERRISRSSTAGDRED